MKIKRYIVIFLFFLLTNMALILSAILVREDIREVVDKNLEYEEDAVFASSQELYEINIKEIDASGTIRLYFPETNKIEVVSTEDYIIGVLMGEMYSDSPLEALKAVAVAARTYSLYMCEQNSKKNYDLEAHPAVSQAYVSYDNAIKKWGALGKEKYEIMKEAVEETKHQVMVKDGELVCALYHASSYPKTENSENVFLEALSYLEGKDSFETINNTYKSTVLFSGEDFNNILKENGYPEIDSDGLEIKNVKNINSRCDYLYISDNKTGFNIDGEVVRNLFSLNSTSFDVAIKDNNIVFEVFGYGHGVGLSQNGAKIMAEMGYSYDEILKYYYSGADIYKTVYKF